MAILSIGRILQTKKVQERHSRGRLIRLTGQVDDGCQDGIRLCINMTEAPGQRHFSQQLTAIQDNIEPHQHLI